MATLLFYAKHLHIAAFGNSGVEESQLGKLHKKGNIAQHHNDRQIVPLLK